jgi:hypothetical protein
LEEKLKYRGGLPHMKYNSARKKMKSRWSIRYKKSINCSNPKGFSQKNYCKRQKRGGNYLEGFKEWIYGHGRS